MEHNEPRAPDPAALKAGHEVADVSVRGIFVFGAILAVTLVVTHFVLLSMHNRLEAKRQAEVDDNPFADLTTKPRGPKLQADPKQDFKVYEKKQQEELTGYGWIDEQKDVVRIPVERAMKLIAEHGPPNPKPKPLPDAKEEQR